ncbi:hypothetical protein QBC33DRAFT_345421 [Phialemonium atrogriseum]|uniref:CENP-V/GFA domain-containing protein n=1 Tax=Phialemonium atrogriseum TaxID=1093897 RepID=A0AAJ0C2X8_9PEZI|nr:uncharacterized protein QBC33DRAFT_345421 [Phialemonium atrogriseum]KAK1769164.1 hypothetical protein QBC33DRAFT_345421 [Phialemonium atrogriseum]
MTQRGMVVIAIVSRLMWASPSPDRQDLPSSSAPSPRPRLHAGRYRRSAVEEDGWRHFWCEECRICLVFYGDDQILYDLPAGLHQASLKVT